MSRDHRPKAVGHIDEWDDGTGRYVELLSLLMDTIEGPDWHKDAACKEHPEVNFFPARGDTAGMRAAKAVCAGCAVRAECLEASRGEREGVWGGMSAAARRKMRRITRPCIPCGTEAAYKRHIRAGETPCFACREANRRNSEERRLKARRMRAANAVSAADYARAYRARMKAEAAQAAREWPA